jgi:hypothetical protein
VENIATIATLQYRFEVACTSVLHGISLQIVDPVDPSRKAMIKIAAGFQDYDSYPFTITVANKGLVRCGGECGLLSTTRGNLEVVVVLMDHNDKENPPTATHRPGVVRMQSLAFKPSVSHYPATRTELIEVKATNGNATSALNSSGCGSDADHNRSTLESSVQALTNESTNESPVALNELPSLVESFTSLATIRMQLGQEGKGFDKHKARKQLGRALKLSGSWRHPDKWHDQTELGFVERAARFDFGQWCCNVLLYGVEVEDCTTRRAYTELAMRVDRSETHQHQHQQLPHWNCIATTVQLFADHYHVDEVSPKALLSSCTLDLREELHLAANAGLPFHEEIQRVTASDGSVHELPFGVKQTLVGCGKWSSVGPWRCDLVVDWKLPAKVKCLVNGSESFFTTSYDGRRWDLGLRYKLSDWEACTGTATLDIQYDAPLTLCEMSGNTKNQLQLELKLRSAASAIQTSSTTTSSSTSIEVAGEFGSRYFPAGEHLFEVMNQGAYIPRGAVLRGALMVTLISDAPAAQVISLKA